VSRVVIGTAALKDPQFVKDMAKAYPGGIVVAVDQSAQLNGRFRVLIREDKSEKHRWPEDRFVRFGAKAQAWVLLESVPVGYEIWRQLNNFPPELPAEETAATTE
jgi:imidazole glycerol phosphate synthase subunit HisF